MSWQDVVLATCQALFTVALLPAIFGPEKPPRACCLMTAVLLAACIPAFVTLGLAWAATTTFLSMLAWTVLLVQRRG